MHSVQHNLFFKMIPTFFLLLTLTGPLPVQGDPAKKTEGSGMRKLAIAITTNDEHFQNLALSNMLNVANALPGEVIIEIVAWGPALPMLTDKSKFKERIRNIQLLGEVTFTACGNTMSTIERNTGKRPVLLEGVKEYTVGVIKVMELQEQGYSILHY